MEPREAMTQIVRGLKRELEKANKLYSENGQTITSLQRTLDEERDGYCAETRRRVDLEFKLEERTGELESMREHYKTMGDALNQVRGGSMQRIRLTIVVTPPILALLAILTAVTVAELWLFWLYP